MPLPPDDKQLIQQVLQGQQTAYTGLVDKYKGYVFTLVLRYVSDRELAEELSQDVFIKAYRYLSDFRGTSRFSTWLYTIVHTTCLSQMRKRKGATVSMDEEQILANTAHLHEGNGVERAMEQKANKQILNRAMQHLPSEDAQIITLFYVAEQSLEEIGIILSITSNSAKVKLYRARQRLRVVLQSRFMNELA